MNMPARLGCVGSIVASLAFGATSACAADTSERYSIDPDFPVRVEDAFPVGYKDAYVKLITRYSNNLDGTDTTTIQPEVAYGFAPNFDVHVISPYLIGDGSRSGSGDFNVNVQYLALEQKEGDWWPSVAIEGDVIVPSGVHSDGLDTIVQVIATQTLSWAPAFDAIHVDLTWTHNAIASHPEERDDGYNAILGFSRRIGDDTVLITDVLWERTLSQGSEAETAEIGVIQSVGEYVLLSAGVGVGLGDDAADYTATVGIIIKS